MWRRRAVLPPPNVQRLLAPALALALRWAASPALIRERLPQAQVVWIWISVSVWAKAWVSLWTWEQEREREQEQRRKRWWGGVWLEIWCAPAQGQGQEQGQERGELQPRTQQRPEQKRLVQVRQRLQALAPVAEPAPAPPARSEAQRLRFALEPVRHQRPAQRQRRTERGR